MCDNYTYCDKANPQIPTILDIIVREYDRKNITPEKKLIYSEMIKRGDIVIDLETTHARFANLKWVEPSFESKYRALLPAQ